MVFCDSNRRVAKQKSIKEFCPLSIIAVSTLYSYLRPQPLPPGTPQKLCASLSQLHVVTVSVDVKVYGP